MALAKSVLPQPCGPENRMLRGIFARRAWYFLGLRRKSMTSLTFSFASSRPPTSSRVTPRVCALILSAGDAIRADAVSASNRWCVSLLQERKGLIIPSPLYGRTDRVAVEVAESQ